MDKDTAISTPRITSQVRKIFLVSFILILGVFWLINTPPGLLGKADAAGYAVCHRISSHSFYFGERPFSFCARCTGQYLGFLWGITVQFALARKRSGFPPRLVLAFMGFLTLFYLFDGLNSVLHLYPGLQHWSLYEPDNTLRLFSGLGAGIVISGILYPLLGQSVWRDVSLEPAFKDLKAWGIFFGGGLLVGLLVLSGNPLILYPLILLSAAGLTLILSLLYAMIWIILMKKDNSFSSWQELGWWWMAGIASALVQIAAIDFVRYQLTGTWSGFLNY
ncbi:MAG: DUF2085 domain-containing protein [Anaerolineales bacterium]|nr:DUF2085 domain-containing protein [Anaerolineales bacterium]